MNCMTARHTRTVLLASASLFALTLTAGTVSAADLGPALRGHPLYDAVEPRSNLERWTGFYLGAAIGSTFGDMAVDGQFGSTGIGGRGAIGSLLAGYNWQIGRMVLGVEADYGMTNYDGLKNNAAGTQLKVDMDQIGSLRGRLGVLMTPSMMLYATGGLAWADVDVSSPGSALRFQEFARGWTAGLGAELLISPKWTMRLEYNYTDLGDRTLGVGGQTNQIGLDFHTVRAGLTFKF